MNSDSTLSARNMTPENAGASRAAMAVMVLALVSASCRPLEQGYWTKPGMSETPQSAEYRRDSEECARQGDEQVTMNKTPKGDTIVARHPSSSDIGSNQYGKCMVSRGYEWVELQPLLPPTPHGKTANQLPCPTERIVSDPFGYPHCATLDPGQRAGPANGLHETGLPDRRPAASSAPSDTVLPRESLLHDNVPREQVLPPSGDDKLPAERRVYDNNLCIKQSQKSLSSPYDTYLRCMTEKGWPALPR